MALSAKRLLGVALGTAALAVAMVVVTPVAIPVATPTAKAQFFNWFDNRPRKPRPPRAVKPRPPPGDDLPPIVPRESTAPPPPDDRPYDTKLLRLAEILGAVHYLRELCGAEEGQLWRDQMKEIIRNEGTTATRRAKFVNSFNDGYRGYRRTYRTCTPSATLAVRRFTSEGARIAAALAKTSEPANPKEQESPDASEAASPEVGEEASSETGEETPTADSAAATEAGEADAQADQGQSDTDQAQAPTAEAAPRRSQRPQQPQPLDLGARVNR